MPVQEMRMSRSLLAVLTLLTLGVGPSAVLAQNAPVQNLPPPAQKIYKVQMPDGSVVFTDSVPRGAKILDERDASKAPQLTIPPPSRPAASTRPSTATDERQASSIDKASNEVQAAERELQEARADLERGREPLEGERQGLRGGGTRLSPAYDDRIRALEQRVAKAEERVKAAYAARNAAR
jgi:hypothetical protein